MMEQDLKKQVDVAVQSIQPTAEMISYFALIGNICWDSSCIDRSSLVSVYFET